MITLILLSTLWHQKVSAQAGLSVRSYPSPGYNFVYQPGMNGMGISMDFTFKKFQTVDINTGLEYRISDWGNLVLISTSARRTWWQNNRLTFNSQAGLINGLALFRPQPLYVFGVETLANLYYRISGRFGISVTAGIRWTTCPAYRNYGLIWGYLEIPVALGVVFSL